MNHPVVSIITPSYNRADLVEETARSIYSQHYPHWEWVIVDDGSTDGSWEILEGFAATDDRVRIFRRHRQPKGACACRNIAVEKATGKYLIFLDTDDVLADHCLEQRVAAMQQAPDIDFIIFPMLMFKRERHDMNLLWNIDKEGDDIERLLFGDGVCPGTGTIWKKESFVRIGMWKEDLGMWQDVELHLRSMLEGLKFAKRFDLPPDIYLRVSDVSISRTGFHSPAVSLLKSLDMEWGLFTRTERWWMMAVVLLYRLRMYRIPGLASRLVSRVRSIEPRPVNTLNKITYSPSNH